MIPTVANWLDQAVPGSIKDRMYAREGKFPNAYINAIAASPTAMNKVYYFRYLVVYFLTYLFALASVYAMYLLCTELGFPSPAAVFTPVIFILMLPYIQGAHGSSYDFPELTFFALAVFVVLKFDWWWVAPIAILAVWNKESFWAFLPTLYPFVRMRKSRLGSLVAVGTLFLLCMPTYLSIHLKFAKNPGGTVWFFLPDQIAQLMHPLSLIKLTQEVYGLPMLSAFTLLPGVLALWTIWSAWPHLSVAFKRHAQIAAAINVPLYVLFCVPGETRDLSMLYISLLVCLAVNLGNWTRQSEHQVAAPPARGKVSASALPVLVRERGSRQEEDEPGKAQRRAFQPETAF
jgi:hypothetical protein